MQLLLSFLWRGDTHPMLYVPSMSKGRGGVLFVTSRTWWRQWGLGCHEEEAGSQASVGSEFSTWEERCVSEKGEKRLGVPKCTTYRWPFPSLQWFFLLLSQIFRTWLVAASWVFMFSFSVDKLRHPHTSLPPAPAQFLHSTCKFDFLCSLCDDVGNAHSTRLGGTGTPGTFLAQLCLFQVYVYWLSVHQLIPGVPCSCFCEVFLTPCCGLDNDPWLIAHVLDLPA